MPELSFISFTLKMIGSKEGREMLQAVRETERYAVWKARQVLEESGVDKEMERKPFHEFPDPSFAKLIGDIMEAEGLARWEADRLKWLSTSGNPPPVTNRYLVSFKPVIDRVYATLPDSLMSGERFMARSSAGAESRAVFGRFLDNLGYDRLRELVVKWANIPPGSLVVDVGAGIGLSSITILRLVPGSRVIAVDPYQPNLEVAKSYAEVLGLSDRLEVRVGRGEEIHRVVKSADFAVMINILHWCSDPLTILNSVREVTPNALLTQGVLDTKLSLVLAPLTYLLGSSILPTMEQLNDWIKTAGWRIEKRMRHPAPAFILKA
ncbi:MAG: class I SAM-dependent methyltransferase [Thermofilaceae archaeon]